MVVPRPSRGCMLIARCRSRDPATGARTSRGARRAATPLGGAAAATPRTPCPDGVDLQPLRHLAGNAVPGTGTTCARSASSSTPVPPRSGSCCAVTSTRPEPMSSPTRCARRACRSDPDLQVRAEPPRSRVRLTDYALSLTEPASTARPSLTDHAPETAVNLASGCTSLRAATARGRCWCNTGTSVRAANRGTRTGSMGVQPSPRTAAASVAASRVILP